MRLKKCGNKNLANPFGKQLLRAPFAVREKENALAAEWRELQQKKRRENASAQSVSLSSDGSSSGESSRVLQCRPLSQQCTKINEGSFRQLNEAAMEPENKWVL